MLLVAPDLTQNFKRSGDILHFLLTADDNIDEQPLREDIYSLMYVAGATTQAFVFAVIVFVVQNLLLWMILLDLIDFDASENKIRMPAGMVNIAQGLGTILIVFILAVYGDLTSGLWRLVDGYEYSVLVTNRQAHGAKWFFSGIAQLHAGTIMM